MGQWPQSCIQLGNYVDGVEGLHAAEAVAHLVKAPIGTRVLVKAEETMALFGLFNARQGGSRCP